MDTISTAIGILPSRGGAERNLLIGELRRLADDTNSDVDQLIGYGPTTYPTAAFGILLSTSVYRTIGDNDWLPLVINKEIVKLDTAINDPKLPSSFVSIRNGLTATAQDQRNAIGSFPRHGKIGCGNQTRITPGGETIDRFYDLYGSIIPGGVPDRPATFNSQDGGPNSGDWLPGENPRNCDNQGHGWAARDYYNGQLAQMRANEDQAQKFNSIVGPVHIPLRPGI